MARLALRIIGGAISFALGFGFGPGAFIGGLIGSILFQDTVDSTVVEGPRLGDLRAQSSQYGELIPKVYGTDRIAGQVGYSSGLKERVVVTEQGGGGGGKGMGGGGGGGGVTTKEYKYSVDLQVFIGEPIIGVLRIWANGKVLRDWSDTNTGAVGTNGNIRIYTGTETQLPDPMLEKAKGVGNVPAARGTAYVVFENLQLANYGNVTPNIEFEVIGNGASAFPTLDTTNSQGETTGDNWIYDANTETIFQHSKDSANGLFEFDPLADVIVSAGVTGDSARTSYLAVDPAGEVTVITIGSGNTPPTYVVPRSGSTFTNTYNSSSVGFVCRNPGSAQFKGVIGRRPFATNNINPKNMLDVYSGRGFVYASSDSTFSDIWLWAAMFSDPPFSQGKVSPANWRDLAYDGAENGNFYLGIISSVAATSVTLFRYELDTKVGKEQEESGACPGITDAGSIDLTSTFSGSNSGINANSSITYWEEENAWLITNGSMIVKYDIASETITSTYDFENGEVVAAVQRRLNGAITSESFWPLDLGSKFAIFDLVNFAPMNDKVYTKSDWSGGSGKDIYGYNTQNHAVLVKATEPQFRWLFLDRVNSSAGITLDTVVSDILQRAGLTPSQIDVTALASHTILGYTLTRQAKVRAAIAPLTALVPFFLSEIDGVVTAITRGGALDATIPESDIGFVSEIPEGDSVEDMLRISRVQSIELPKRINVRYKNEDRDYEADTQHFQRVEGSVETDEIQTVNLAVVITNDFAKRVAEKIMLAQWSSRLLFEFTLNRKWLSLTPGDVVQITVDGTNYRVFLEEIELGADFIIKCKGNLEDPTAYSSTITGTSIESIPKQTIDFRTTSQFVLMDTPPLRKIDLDDDFWLVAAGPSRDVGSWPGAVIQSRQPDWPFFIDAIVMPNQAVIGQATTALPDWRGGSALFDDVNTVDVRLTSREDDVSTTTTTLIELLNDPTKNAIWLAGEIIQYQTIAQNADDTYRLSGLIRGRRGTEDLMAGHAVGDDVVWFESTGTLRKLHGEELLNVEYEYRIRTTGLTAHTGDELFTFTGRSLKGISPDDVQLTRATSGNMTLTWRHRDRADFFMRNGLGSAEIDPKSYQIDWFTEEEFRTATTPVAWLTENVINAETSTGGTMAVYIANAPKTGETEGDIPMRIDLNGTSPAPIWVIDEDFETGGVAAWTNDTGTLALESSVVFRGLLSATSSSGACTASQSFIDVDVGLGLSTAEIDADELAIWTTFWAYSADGVATAQIEYEFSTATPTLIDTQTMPARAHATATWEKFEFGRLIPATTRDIKISLILSSPNAKVDHIRVRIGNKHPGLQIPRIYQMNTLHVGRGTPSAVKEL